MIEPFAQAGIQVVLQLRRPNGSIVCRGYAGVPTARQALIEVVAAPGADRLAAELVAALDEELLLMPGASAVTPPCGGRQRGMYACRVHTDPEAAKVLVVVGDGETPIPSAPSVAKWRARGSDYSVVPVLKYPRAGGTTPLKIETLLPPELQLLQVALWFGSPREVVGDILAEAYVMPVDRRVFISYRRKETLELAEQLFEELSKHRFDVFVDRFRIEPGRDFQERLKDDLAHHGLAVILESPGLIGSAWVVEELAYMTQHQLGRIAVNLCGAPETPQVDPDLRVYVGMAELTQQSQPAATVQPEQRLLPATLARVVAAIIAEHNRSYARRRSYLMESLRAALAQRGITDQRLDSQGHLHVVSSAPGRGPREYVIWTNPRPPEVRDFRSAHRVCMGSTAPYPSTPYFQGAVVIPAAYQEARRHGDAMWLANRSAVALVDIGALDRLVLSIEQGADLA